MTTDARAVRTAEQLDWAALEQWVRQRLPACGINGLDLGAAMEVAQFPGGHSNLTYLLRFGGTELVLRRPPFGPVPPTAHDMAREFRWLSAMHPVFPLAPRVYLLNEDPAIVGSVFYIMERRHGIVVRHEEPPSIKDNLEMRRRVGTALIDALADLHAIDVERAGLGHLGKPAGFVGRQVRGWSERWQRSQTTDVPEMDALAAWLVAELPPDPLRPSVVHGDFKLDNLMLSAGNPDQIVAVFDWEMSALGDPLVDLGIVLAYWMPTAPPEQHDALSTVTSLPGWLTPAEVIDRYQTRSGRDLSTLRYFEVFALFKIAVVIQQIYYRFVAGQTDDPRFATFGARVHYLARAASAKL